MPPRRHGPRRSEPPPLKAAIGRAARLGGSNGASSVNNGFVEPGAYVCPSGSSFGSNCFETPFQFSGHKTVYTIGPFIGYRWMIGKGPYPGATVFGIEGDWSFKNAETSLNQSSSTLIALTGSNVLRTDQFSGSVKQKSELLNPRPPGRSRHAVESAVRDGRRRVRRNQRIVCVCRKPLPCILVLLLHLLVLDRHRNDRGKLERHATGQHGRRGLGNGNRAGMEG